MTVPFPVPDAPEVTVSQLVLLLTAVQAQPLPAVTLTLLVPPPAAGEALVGEMLYVHVPAPAPAWVMVNGRPAMVSVPVRALGPVFACTA